MRFRTRVLLLWLIPVAALLSGSFWVIQRMVQSIVHDGLRQSLRLNQAALAEASAVSAAHEERFLKIAGENSALKAGLQLVLVEGSTPATRATLEDQLSDLCGRKGFDLLAAATPDGRVLGGVIRTGQLLVPLRGPNDENRDLASDGDFLPVGREVYKIRRVPVELGGETVATLIVGDVFELPQNTTGAVLLQDGRVLRSNVPGVTPEAAGAALKHCTGPNECDVRIGNSNFVSLPFAGSGGGYRVVSLQTADVVTLPVTSGLRWVFVYVFAVAALMAVFCGILSSRSIVRPILALVKHLQQAEQSGQISAVPLRGSGILELDELTRSLNQAAAATSEARDKLEGSYLQFVGTLARALDSRDRYTAGHSQRVSELAGRLSVKLGLVDKEVERIRMGALLHDIGKVGISDTVLLKPGNRSQAEMAMIRQHPQIGRRILEKVPGFSGWLDAVELHHENWDGTGNPYGLRGECVPLEARIIHVADAYDGMTSDRPYRKGMGHERAILNIKSRAGADFDPAIVACIASLTETGDPGKVRSGPTPELRNDISAVAAGEKAQYVSGRS